MKIIIGFLLFSTSVFAQYPKSEFDKRVDSINAILYKTKKVRYVNSDEDCFFYFLRKIKANKNGNVTVINPLSSDYKTTNPIIFNLLQLKGFVRYGNEIHVMDKNGKKIVAITNVGILDIRKLIDQFDALRNICILYAKENHEFKSD